MGVDEVLLWIARKIVMYITKKNVKDVPQSLIVCVGQEAGSEAVIHAIYDFYQTDETEAILQVDADNAFNSINRKAMLLVPLLLVPWLFYSFILVKVYELHNLMYHIFFNIICNIFMNSFNMNSKATSIHIT